MNRKLLTVALSFLIISVSVAAYTYWDEKSVATITFPLGTVMKLAAGEKKLKKAGFNEKLFAGDKIQTKKSSRCEIKYNDGSIIRIDQLSIYTIEKAEISSEGKKVESSLSLGSLWANIKKLANSADGWLLRGPSAVVAVRGTIYRMDANEDKTSRVFVYDGSVNVAPSWAPDAGKQQGRKPGPPTQVKGPSQVSLKEWTEIVKAQQQITVSPDGSFEKSEFDLASDANSSWVKWNMERDKLLE